VSSILKHPAAALTQVFIELDEHGSFPDLDVSLPRHLRPVGDASPHVCLFDSRVVFEDLRDRPSGRQEIENQRDPDPVSLDTWLAEADVRVNTDVFQNVVAAHCCLSDGRRDSLSMTVSSILSPTWLQDNCERNGLCRHDNFIVQKTITTAFFTVSPPCVEEAPALKMPGAILFQARGKRFRLRIDRRPGPDQHTESGKRT
jgi:hypothetical protein